MDDKNSVTIDAPAIDAPAIACDLTDAPDTAEERMAEYDRLFTQALAGRALLDTYYHAPDYAADGVAGMTKWLAGEGFAVTANESGMVMQFDSAVADEATSGA